MNILVMILKIIGIVLLVLVILILVLLLLFLFAPITYKAEGSYKDNKPYGRLRAHYLFPILTAYLLYDDSPEGKVKVLGIPVYDFFAPPDSEKEAKKRKKKKKKPTEAAQKPKRQAKAEQPAHKDIRPESGQAPEQSPAQQEKPPSTSQSIGADRSSTAVQTIAPTEKESRQKQFFKQVKQGIKKLIAMFKRWKNGVFRFKEKVKSLLETMRTYMALWEREETKRAFAKAKKTIGILLKGICPRKGKLHLHFGTEDPSSTGEICAFLGMIYPFVGNYVMIEPDFEKPIFEADFNFKGYLTIYMLLRVWWVYTYDKEIQAFKNLLDE